MSNVNPFQSPEHEARLVSPELQARSLARFRFRRICLLMFLAAMYNLWEFNLRTIPQFRRDLQLLSLAFSMFLLLAGTILLFRAGLPLLENCSLVLRRIFARHVDRAAWLGVLYESLRRALLLAIPGACLWVAWVFAFYRLQQGQIFFSFVASVLGNLLAAGWYVPLFMAWRQLWYRSFIKENPS